MKVWRYGVQHGGCGLQVVSLPASPRAFELPLAAGALLLLDFQRDYLCPGGYCEALGHQAAALQVGFRSQQLAELVQLIELTEMLSMHCGH